MRTAGVLLAAGASRRFGQADKLLAVLHGRQLIRQAADAADAAQLDLRIAVTSSDEVAKALPEFRISRVAPDQPQSTSLATGIMEAMDQGADRAVVLLADMPLITADMIDGVIELAGDGVAAITDGRRVCPPACFPRDLFPELTRVSGDQGARALLSGLGPQQLLRVPSSSLVDIDTLEDLDRLSRPRGTRA
ncbi:nucleotidyltransferase family protein [Rubellimicrobium arenae]|uniref:nucleotidyltransferase family protein n=1 Tax=Rubellimicrobium arenae TaxID=2817372 RepID=UPI001B3087A4|nr:nucleotidyltransferase family protein [Rubellimicrobium arenae]